MVCRYVELQCACCAPSSSQKDHEVEICGQQRTLVSSEKAIVMFER